MLLPSEAGQVDVRERAREVRAYLGTRAGRVELGLVAVTVLALTVAAAAVAVPAAGEFPDVVAPGPIPSGKPSPTAGEPAPERPPLEAAPDGGELLIEDSGFSLVESTRDDVITWGLVVQNTSELAAATVRVDVSAVDAAGETVLSGDDEQHQRGIGLVLPDAPAGIGGIFYVTDPQVTDLTVEVSRVDWWPTDYDCVSLACPLIEPEIGQVTAGEVEEVATDGRRAPLTLRFRVESEYDYILESPSAQAVFRDQHGDIIGGTGFGDTEYRMAIPPGWSTHYLYVRHPPPLDLVDVARTEIYPYADCC